MPNQAAGSAPLVSVIMPVYNGAATIERALRSLRAQTFTHWEAVAVDDASLDGTWEKLQSAAAADARIPDGRLAKNSGPSAARNAGLRLATGEFIAYLDADDEYYPDYLEQVAAARSKGDVLMFGFDVVYEDGLPRSRTEDWDPKRSPHPVCVQPGGSAGGSPSSQPVGQGGRVSRVDLAARRLGLVEADGAQREQSSLFCPARAAFTMFGRARSARPIA